MSTATLAALGKARARLLLKSAFFGTLIITTPTVITTSIPTAGTDMIRIAYNPDFVAEQSPEQLIGLMAHEVLHIALMHGFRRGGRDPRLWNIAADHAINLMLLDMGFQLPHGGYHDPRFKRMSAEAIYDVLYQEKGPSKKKSKQGQPDQGQPGEAGSGGADPSDPSQGGAPGDPGDPGIGQPMAAEYEDIPGWGADLIEPSFDSPEAAQRAQEDVKAKVVQATNMGRMAGTMPGELLRLLDELIHPDVPWADLMRPMMRSIVKVNESWSKRNRRFADVYLPSNHSPAIGTVVVIGDTSGSITNNDLKKIGGSVCDIAEEVTPEKVHVLWADTKVAGEQEFDRGDDIKLEPKGGGGTDMRVPLARAAELEPAMVVLITDGYTPWPDVEPDYPMIVVCTHKDVHIPVGEVVRI